MKYTKIKRVCKVQFLSIKVGAHAILPLRSLVQKNTLTYVWFKVYIC
jgi:hypothetical protein